MYEWIETATQRCSGKGVLKMRSKFEESTHAEV